jgi:dTDP-4-dehydrorhamnose 3,5-epimerase-like enzyme
MAIFINLETVQNPKGKLTIFERLLTGGIKRVFYIYDSTDEIRGGHRHKKSTHALTCPMGACTIYVNDGKTEQVYELDSPEKCLVLAPTDWREMTDFKENTLLLCMSNQYYDPEDYITEPYYQNYHVNLMAHQEPQLGYIHDFVVF